MSLARSVQPEWLDQLPHDDPRAVRSRHDLRRVNFVLGSHGILLRALDAVVGSTPPRRIIEIGAGEGMQMLRLAQARGRRWPRVEAVVLDRQPVVADDTLDAIRETGWDVEMIIADVFDSLPDTPSKLPVAERAVVFANLFVHHFERERLTRLIHGIAANARAFVCCEPRRSRANSVASRLLGLVGCNDVSRHDALLSVHAGFRDHELAALWPERERAAWRFLERRAGLFSHLFAATRIDV